MQPKALTAKPLDKVIYAIRALDLETVKRQLTDPIVGKGWTREHADSTEVGYKNFLMMVAEHQEQAEDIKLSKDIDDFWHTHILQTMKYATDCENVFGFFLHHRPEISVHAEQQAAYCTAAVSAQETAYCTAAVSTQDAAYCTAAIQSQQAAYCTAAIAMAQQAYCTAAVEPQQAAYCTAAAGVEQQAYCTAAIRPQQAYCTAAIRPKEAAYCTASVSTR